MVAYAAAAIVGFTLGSYRYLTPASVDRIEDAPSSTSAIVTAAPSQSPTIPVSPGDRGDAQESSTRNRRNEPKPQNTDESDGLVFAGEGLVLRPAVTGDGFIGFLVVRNDSDRRFSVGDVIVSVNDQPVEHSAAGSELLIASLADPDALVETRSGKIE